MDKLAVPRQKFINHLAGWRWYLIHEKAAKEVVTRVYLTGVGTLVKVVYSGEKVTEISAYQDTT